MDHTRGLSRNRGLTTSRALRLRTGGAWLAAFVAGIAMVDAGIMGCGSDASTTDVNAQGGEGGKGDSGLGGAAGKGGSAGKGGTAGKGGSGGDAGPGGSAGMAGKAGAAGSSGADAGPECSDPTADCPDPGTVCAVAICDTAAKCATENAAKDTACTDHGGKVCDGNGKCSQCTDPALHCAAPTSECAIASCDLGVCGTTPVADGTATTNGQIAGDCKKQVCDGAGSTKIVNDDTDPTDDVNECTSDTCDAGLNVHTPVGAGAACTVGGKVCGSGAKEGTCVACLQNADCTGGDVCDTAADNFVCVPPTCSDGQQDGFETDKDCGGTGCGPCQNDQKCVLPTDCVSQFCLTGTCAACTADADCAAGQFCNTTTHICTADQGDGSPCTSASQCVNANCVDGICCDKACTGTCDGCSAAKKGQGLDGVCGPIATGTDPDNECDAAAASTCGTTGVCDGASACQRFSSSTVCVAPTCAGGVAQHADLCDGKGVCVDGGSASCGAYVCNAGGTACLSACASGSDCAAGYYCNGASQCVSLVINGGICTGSNECSSGQCVDSVCCDSACSGLCQACVATKTGAANGTCANVQPGTDPDNECAASDPSTCGTSGVCGATGVCALFASGTECAAATCSGGVAHPVDTCNGSGTCVDGGSLSCGAYVCDAGGTACLSACASGSDCATGNYCNSTSQCVPLLANGGVCTGNSQCTSGFCVDGTCCNTACSGLCQACSSAKTSGTNGACATVPLNTDPDSECSGALNCNGSGACTTSGNGSNAANAGTTCKGIHADYPSFASGTYWIDPDGTGSIAPLQVYCDMTTDGGGYTYYGIGAGINTCRYMDNNSCKAVGMDIVMPRTKNHWLSMLNQYGASYFSTVPGVFGTTASDYTGCIMRNPATYGSGCPNWRVGDGHAWWIRDTVFSEPNGDYTAGCWLGLASAGYGITTTTIDNGQGFNDNNCNYCTTRYICSTNDKW